MQARSAALAGLAAVALCLPGSALLAQDKPPPVPPDVSAPAARTPFDADIDLLHRCVGQQGWQQGVEAAAAIFRRYPDDRRLLVRLDEIEEDLKVCTYRAQRKPLDGAAVLGRSVTKFSFSTRNADFRFRPTAIASEAGSPGWAWIGDVAVFDVPMEGAISVTMSIPPRSFVRSLGELFPLPACVLCYDTETRGGYTIAITPAHRGYAYNVRFTRLGDDPKSLAEPVRAGLSDELSIEVKLTRTVTGQFGCSINGTKVAEAKDQRFTRGLVAFLADRELFASVRTLEVTGRVDATYARRIESEAENACWQEWLAEGWDREKALPAWILEAEKRLPPPPLPSDASADVRRRAEPLLPLLLEGDLGARFDARAVADAALPHTAAYLYALAAFAEGDWAKSDAHLRSLLEDERSFGPGWVLLARSHLERGDRGAACKALDDARAAAPKEPGIQDTLAAIELSEGRLDGAEKALDLAAASGSVTPWGRQLRRVLLRVQRGPQWQRRFDFESAHYRVSGDSNLDACMEVAKVLEEANASYKAKFRARADGAKAQVLVFSGVESYLDYAGALGADLTNSLGVYMPKLRQLCVFLHEDRRTLWDTVRHEGFHQYLHQFVESAPDWFNEGTAEYFGFVRKSGGRHVTGTADVSAVGALAACRRELTPLEDLFVMNHARFMEKANVHYPQSWLVIHFLRETQDPELVLVLDRYLDALIARKTHQQAFDDVLRPLLPAIRKGVAEHADALIRGLGRSE